jgi:hypothetical protein
MLSSREHRNSESASSSTAANSTSAHQASQPRQFNHLDFVAQFITDIWHVSEQDSVVADTLSRVECITAPLSYDALAISQDSNDELQTLLGSTTALQLKKLPIPGTTVSIYCDTSARRSRPYIPAPLWRQVFQSAHDLSHQAPKQCEAGRTGFCVVRCAKGFATPGHVLASSASAPKSPATQSLHWATLHRQ